MALDTNVFIYELDVYPKYVEVARSVFEWLAQPGRIAVVSTIVMTEVMTGPYRARDEVRADAFRRLLFPYPHLEWTPPGLAIADLAARYRAEHRLRTADAIVAATTTHAAATLLISNDPGFERVPDFKTVLLDDLL